MKLGVKLAAGAAALAMMLGAAQASQAAIVDWTLSNGTFDDGGTFSGTFTFDTATDTITDWNVSSSGVNLDLPFGGPTGTIAYQSGGGLGSAADTGSGPTFSAFVLPFFVSVFNLTNIPLAGPGSVAHLTGDESELALGFIPFGSHTVTDGQAVGVLAGGVPEPATWAMMILGAGLAGAGLRRSRRAAVAA